MFFVEVMHRRHIFGHPFNNFSLPAQNIFSSISHAGMIIVFVVSLHDTDIAFNNAISATTHNAPENFLTGLPRPKLS